MSRPRGRERRLLLAAFLVAPAASALLAFDIDIGGPAIERAIALGRSTSVSTRQRFHDRYQVPVPGVPVVARLEILTEVRRVVLASEERAAFGDSGWGRQQIEAALRPYRGTVTLRVDVQFPPLNSFRAMPGFDVVLYARPGSDTPARIEPMSLQQTPRYVAGQPAPPGTPILGGRVEAIFDARTLDRRGIYLVGILQDGRELARVSVDFGKVD